MAEFQLENPKTGEIFAVFEMKIGQFFNGEDVQISQDVEL